MVRLRVARGGRGRHQARRRGPGAVARGAGRGLRRGLASAAHVHGRLRPLRRGIPVAERTRLGAGRRATRTGRLTLLVKSKFIYSN